MTVDGRYGPYGYGEDKPGYTRSKVDWEKVDWAQLQNHCLSGNRRRFESAENVSNKPRFHLHTKIEKFKSSLRSVLSHHSNTQPEDRTSQNRQQVIVLRGYDDYEYKDKDLHNIRALITEAGLASGGEYAVVLMIHVRDKQMNIFDSEENYNRVFNKIVPSELRSITILFDDHLLKSWYPKLGEHS